MLIFLPLFGAASDFCDSAFEDNFFSSPKEKRKVDETIEDLEDLTPIDLAETNLKEGLENLFKELTDLKPLLEELREIDRASMDENSKAAAKQALEKNISELQELAEEVLRNNPNDEKQRRRAEGLKHLLKASNEMSKKFAPAEQESSGENGEPAESSQKSESGQNSESSESSKGQKSENSDSESRESSQKQSQSEQEKPQTLEEMIEQLKKQAEDLQNNIEQNRLEDKAREQMQNNEPQKSEQNDQQQKSEKGKEESQQQEKAEQEKSDLDNLSEEQRKELEKEYEELKELVDQLKQQLEEEKSQQSEGEKSENEKSEESEGEKSEQGEGQEPSGQQNTGESGEKSNEQGSPEQSSGEPSGNSSQGKPSSYEQLKDNTEKLKQELEDMKQQLQDMAEQKSEGEGEKSEQDGENSEGKDGESGEGKPEGESGEGKSEKQQGEGSQPGKDGEGEPGEAGKSEGELDISSKLYDEFKDLFDFKDSKKESEKQEEESLEDKINLDELLKDFDVEESPKAESDLKSEKQKDFNFKEDKQELDFIPQDHVNENVKKLVEYLWVRALRSYKNSKDLMQSISSFSRYVNNLSTDHKNNVYVKQMTKIARTLYQDLDSLNVNYRELGEIATSHFSPNGSNGEVLKKLKFFKKILSEIEKHTTLTSPEKQLLSLVNALEGRLNSEGTSDKAFSDAFLSQVKGPLTNKIINSKYISSEGSINYKDLARDIKSGVLNDLLVYSAIRQYAEIFNNLKNTPVDSKENKGHKEVINESEPDLMIADDLSNYHNFYKEGDPILIELMKFIAGDMLENIYREEVPLRNPKDPIIKKASFVLFDISGSMSGDKQKIRNALINTYLDMTFTEVAKGNEEHTVYLVPFEMNVKDSEVVRSVKEAQEYFDRMREAPVGSSGGTKITNALVDAMKKIFDHQQNSGELDKANILLITDGMDSVDLPLIKEHQEKVNEKTEIYLNTIMLETKNSDLEQLVKEQNEGARVPKASATFIETSDVRDLVDQNKQKSRIQDMATTFDRSLETKLDQSIFLELKNRIFALMENPEKYQQVSNDSVEQLKAALRGSTEGKYHHQINHYFELLRGATHTEGLKKLTSNDRVSLLLDVASIVSKAYKAPKEQVILNLNEELKTYFLKWIGN